LSPCTAQPDGARRRTGDVVSETAMSGRATTKMPSARFAAADDVHSLR
jgi:hypothetical protein